MPQINHQNTVKMKKLLLLIGVLISFSNAFASKSDVYITSYKKGNVDNRTTVRRSPQQLPINVYYDNEARQIEVTGDEELNIQIYLYDENQNTLNYSSCINTTLDVPSNYNRVLIIHIENDDWIATGEIIV